MESPDLVFRVITLSEPPKKQMIAFLDLEHGQPKQDAVEPPARTAKIQAYVDKVYCEFKINLDEQAIESKEVLHGRHSHIDGDYMRKVELACLASPLVQEQIKGLNLPEGATVVVEPWTYGTDGLNDMLERVTMVCTHLPRGDYTLASR